MTSESRNKRVIAAEAAFNKAQVRYNQVLFEEILRCKHERVVSAAAEYGTYLHLPEMRVCLDCGVCEQDHHGFDVLHNEFRKSVDRDTVYKLRRVQFSDKHLEEFRMQRVRGRPIPLEAVLRELLCIPAPPEASAA